MMLSAAVQARRALDERRRGLADLEGATCEWLDREFRIVLGADAHYLMPPPEEAW
jgi:hypothetical protein